MDDENIIEWNKKYLRKEYKCQFRNSMYELTLQMSKYVGFSLDVCAEFWKSFVKNKILCSNNHAKIVAESIEIYKKSKESNKNIQHFFEKSLPMASRVV